MIPTRIRAEDVAQLLSALDRAAVATQDNYPLWADIISARAFVRVCLAEQFQPLEVIITTEEQSNV
jgi:hypothetical protein